MKLKVSEKGNRIWIEVENVCEAYGWNDSKTCYVEWFDIVKDQLGQTTLTKRSTMVYESIKRVIHKIEKERARKELQLNGRQKEVFQRWRAKA